MLHKTIIKNCYYVKTHKRIYVLLGFPILIIVKFMIPIVSYSIY